MLTSGQLSLSRMLKILDPCQKLNPKASFFSPDSCQVNSNKLVKQALWFSQRGMSHLCGCHSWYVVNMLSSDTMLHMFELWKVGTVSWLLLFKQTSVCLVALHCQIFHILSFSHNLYSLSIPKQFIYTYSVQKRLVLCIFYILCQGLTCQELRIK